MIYSLFEMSKLCGYLGSGRMNMCIGFGCFLKKTYQRAFNYGGEQKL